MSDLIHARLTVVHVHADGKTYLSDDHFFQDKTWTEVMMLAASWLREFGKKRQIVSAVLSNEMAASNGARLGKCFQPGEWEGADE